MSHSLITKKPYNPDNIHLNEDELTFINNNMAVPINSTYTAVKDLEGNGQDWIKEAVQEGFRIHDEKYCNEHLKQTAKNTKKLRIHDWWLWALSTSVAIIILILIFA